jgi:hypothetical protein
MNDEQKTIALRLEYVHHSSFINYHPSREFASVPHCANFRVLCDSEANSRYRLTKELVRVRE